MMKKTCFLFLVSCFLFFGCGKPSATIPDTYTDIDAPAVIYPDYDSITIPPNIAPLSFIITDSLADAFVAAFTRVGDGSHVILATAADASGIIQPDTTAWHDLLKANQGKTLGITIYARHDTQWVQLRRGW